MDIQESSSFDFRVMLRQYRLSAGLTQEELAEKADMSVRGLSDLERGARSLPRRATFERLANALGLDEGQRQVFEITARHLLLTPSPDFARQSGRPPVLLNTLIGRDREIAALQKLLHQSDVRLVTLTGPGGVGKTRLALHVAETMRADYEDGIVFVDLAPLDDQSELLAAIAVPLALRESGKRRFPDCLFTYLETRHLLLILDNFERVTVSAPWIAMLLVECPNTQVLVTSRIPLHLSAEHQFQVSPLRLPDPAVAPSPIEVARAEAIQLFVTRASAANPDFQLDEANAATVAAICQRLDGLPLAIELAAARIRHLSPASLLIRLDRRLELLTGGVQDQPARLKSMRDAIAWSHDLLSPLEQVLFRRLAVFVNGFTLAAVVHVCGGPDLIDHVNRLDPEHTQAAMHHLILDGIASLVDKSLVKPEGQDSGEPRFSMLETIREFGLEQLEASGEAETIGERHAAWCIELAELAEAARTGQIPATGIQDPGQERDNVRTALQWLRTHGKIGSCLRLASSLWTLWSERGEITEGRMQLTAALAQPGATAYESAFAKATGVLGILAQAQGDQEGALSLSKQSLAICRRLGDPRGEAFALNTLGLVAMVEGDYDCAETHLQRSLTLFLAAGDARAGFWSYRHLGSLA